MAELTGALWAVIQEWIDAQPYPPSQRKLASRIGVGHSTITDWKYCRTFPSPEDLLALAAEIRVPYERVLDAALRDGGYRPGSVPPSTTRAGATRKSSGGPPPRRHSSDRAAG